jgi:hypothetical protein
MGLLVANARSSAHAEESPAPVNYAGAPAPQTDPTTPPTASDGALAPGSPAMPSPANPALDFHTQAPEQPSIFHRWWFWTAVGAAAAATVVIIVVSSRGHAPPSTDLGNQEFQP